MLVDVQARIGHKEAVGVCLVDESVVSVCAPSLTGCKWKTHHARACDRAVSYYA